MSRDEPGLAERPAVHPGNREEQSRGDVRRQRREKDGEADERQRDQRPSGPRVEPRTQAMEHILDTVRIRSGIHV